MSTSQTQGQKRYPKELSRQRFRRTFGRTFSKPLFQDVMTGNPLELFRKSFGAVRAIFWLWGFFSLLTNTAHELALRNKTQVSCLNWLFLLHIGLFPTFGMGCSPELTQGTVLAQQLPFCCPYKNLNYAKCSKLHTCFVVGVRKDLRSHVLPVKPSENVTFGKGLCRALNQLEGAIPSKTVAKNT